MICESSKVAFSLMCALLSRFSICIMSCCSSWFRFLLSDYGQIMFFFRLCHSNNRPSTLYKVAQPSLAQSRKLTLPPRAARRAHASQPARAAAATGRQRQVHAWACLIHYTLFRSYNFLVSTLSSCFYPPARDSSPANRPTVRAGSSSSESRSPDRALRQPRRAASLESRISSCRQ